MKRAPQVLAVFLTREFYSDNVSMGHRLHILKVRFVVHAWYLWSNEIFDALFDTLFQVVDAAAIALSNLDALPLKADSKGPTPQIEEASNTSDERVTEYGFPSASERAARREVGPVCVSL